MAKKRIDDDDDFEFEDDFPEDEPNESNMESAMVARDYSDRRILLLEQDPVHRALSLDVLRDLLTGAAIDGAGDQAGALAMIEEGNYDTYVVDFQEKGVSTSDFVKEINNTVDATLIAVNLPAMTAGEDRNRFRLEPLRKLFDPPVPPGTAKPKVGNEPA